MRFELKKAKVRGNDYYQIWVKDKMDREICFHLGSLEKVLTLCRPDWKLVIEKKTEDRNYTKLTTDDVLATNSCEEKPWDLTNGDDFDEE